MSRSAWPDDPVELLRALYPHLRPLAQRIAPREAEDLVQDVFLRMLITHPGFRGITHPLGYAKAVLVRAASKRRRAAELVADVPAELIEKLDASRMRGWEEEIDSRVDVTGVLETLGPRQRSVLYLKFVHGLDDNEIAAVMGVENSTVRSQASRALKRLKTGWERTQ